MVTNWPVLNSQKLPAHRPTSSLPLKWRVQRLGMGNSNQCQSFQVPLNFPGHCKFRNRPLVLFATGSQLENPNLIPGSSQLSFLLALCVLGEKGKLEWHCLGCNKNIDISPLFALDHTQNRNKKWKLVK